MIQASKKPFYQSARWAYQRIMPHRWRLALWTRRHRMAPPAELWTDVANEGFWQPQPQSERQPVNTGEHSTALTSVEALAQLGPDARAEAISALMQPFLRGEGGNFRDYFSKWEREGFHVTPNHYDQPIPDTINLPDALWQTESHLPGIAMNVATQLRFAAEVFPQYQPEYSQFPINPTSDSYQFYIDNQSYIGIDPYVLHCMVRHVKPQRIVEVGSGFSSLIMAHAAALNGNVPEYTVIDPYPGEAVRQGVPGITKVISQPVEQANPMLFSTLRSGDILFIDSSHVVRTGGDVTCLFLEILPQLNSGVIVHVHDIFLPFQYPRRWIVEGRYYWTEQYLFQAFLTHNSAFKVMFANQFMYRKHHNAVALFPSFPHRWLGGSSSFWIKKERA